MTQIDPTDPFTRDLLRDLPGASVLDVGGGHGQMAPSLTEQGHRVSVLTSSPRAIAPMLKRRM